ncbi:MAG: ABC transporter ATP-binding protein [Chloroflexota bacterium]|nr:ABC transporter ATP-binding protein [Chloroflexota bacterium]
MSSNGTLLHVEDLKLYFRSNAGVVQAVDEVMLDLNYNEAIVILGESGCGKTSLARALLRLLPRNVDTYTGKVYLGDTELMSMEDEEYRREVRWVRMSMVPQAAMNALNPVLKVGDQLSEPMMVHAGLKKDEALLQAQNMFERVGLPVDFINRYPFELSGGMRQRVAIAMSLVSIPEMVILDEPTSALDVLTQANIFNLLKRIKKELEISFILITHDIATSSELADRVAVMYAGQIVEVGDAADFFPAPLHPYAQKLMASVPRLRGTQELEFIVGKPPSLIDLPPSCRFAPRCPFRFEKCDEDPPVFDKGGRRVVKCWLHEDT